MNSELKSIIKVALLTVYGGQFAEKEYNELEGVFWGIVEDKLLELPKTVSVTQVIDTVDEGSTVVGLTLDSLG